MWKSHILRQSYRQVNSFEGGYYVGLPLGSPALSYCTFSGVSCASGAVITVLSWVECQVWARRTRLQSLQRDVISGSILHYVHTSPLPLCHRSDSFNEVSMKSDEPISESYELGVHSERCTIDTSVWRRSFMRSCILVKWLTVKGVWIWLNLHADYPMRFKKHQLAVVVLLGSWGTAEHPSADDFHRQWKGSPS